MKKILYSIFAIALALPAMASAATFSFTPSSATLKPGQTFSASVFVTPSTNEKITTAKLSLDFSPDLLEVVSFTSTTGWIALPLPGSDLIDNTKGKLIKTGGLPAKVTTTKQFGTIVFKAKKEGNAKIGTNSGSMLIDTTNTNKYIASTGANLTIKTPAPAKTPTPKPKPTPKKPTITKKPPVSTSKPVVPALKKPVVTSTTTSDVATSTELTANATTTQEEVENGLQGQQASIVGTASTKTIWYYAFGIIILALLGLFVWKRKKND